MRVESWHLKDGKDFLRVLQETDTLQLVVRDEFCPGIWFGGKQHPGFVISMKEVAHHLWPLCDEESVLLSVLL